MATRRDDEEIWLGSIEAIVQHHEGDHDVYTLDGCVEAERPGFSTWQPDQVVLGRPTVVLESATSRRARPSPPR